MGGTLVVEVVVVGWSAGSLTALLGPFGLLLGEGTSAAPLLANCMVAILLCSFPGA